MNNHLICMPGLMDELAAGAYAKCTANGKTIMSSVLKEMQAMADICIVNAYDNRILFKACGCNAECVIEDKLMYLTVCFGKPAKKERISQLATLVHRIHFVLPRGSFVMDAPVDQPDYPTGILCYRDLCYYTDPNHSVQQCAHTLRFMLNALNKLGGVLEKVMHGTEEEALKAEAAFDALQRDLLREEYGWKKEEKK